MPAERLLEGEFYETMLKELERRGALPTTLPTFEDMQGTFGPAWEHYQQGATVEDIADALYLTMIEGGPSA